MDYESLLKQADRNGLIVKEKPLQSSDGRIKGNRIAIRQNLDTNVEKACVLAEELGHHYTSTGNILDMSNISNRKQERQARLWAYDCQIGLNGLISAYEHKCKDKHEIADFLGVTEEFLEEAIECYKDKYGTYISFKNYMIYFIPNLIISKKI